MTFDVSATRAHRLRRRCHRALETGHLAGMIPSGGQAFRWRRVVSLVAAGWCVLYVVEIIRQAVTVFGS